MAASSRLLTSVLVAVLVALILPVTAIPGTGPRPVPTSETVIDLGENVLAGGRGLAGGGQVMDGPGLPVAAQTAAMDTDEFGLVGLTWETPPPENSVISVRTRTGGTWSGWTDVPVGHDHGPDADSPERGDAISGTDPLLTGTSDGIQVRVKTPDGVSPENAQVHLVDTEPGDVQQSPLAQANAAPGKPEIFTRAEWGADESMRNRDPIYSDEVRVGFVHHTASSSDYKPEESAAQMRMLYAWYTKSLKYSDIAYNFLVDRYGRLFEGRFGGMERPVVGGHTAGLNDNSFAVSAIGNFDTFDPADRDMDAIRESIAQLMAWKLGLTGRNPGGTDKLVSSGSLNSGFWEKGETATLKRVSGHRDAGNTACPGKYLYSEVKSIRSRAAELFDTKGPVPPPPDPAPETSQDVADFVVPEKPSSRFTFLGSGDGDGVGVPKAGVLGQARDGRRADRILRHYLTGTRVSGQDDSKPVAVSLSDGAASLTIDPAAAGKAPAGIQVGSGKKAWVGDGGSSLRAVARGDQVVVSARQGKGRKATWRKVAQSDAVPVHWAGTREPGRAGSGATVVTFGSDRLRQGKVRLTASGSKLHVTALLRVDEEYLPYVREVPASWPAQAQQAIAIAVRSRALAAQVNESCDCQVGDGSDSPSGPAFLGDRAAGGKAASAWRKALRGTAAKAGKGKVVVADGKVVPVPLFGSSGGATLDSEDVWGSAAPWARSVDDPWSLQAKNNPRFARWRPQQRTQQQVAAAFGLPDVARIDLSDRARGGAVRTAKAVATDGKSASLSGEAFRAALGLPSAFLSRGTETLPAGPAGLSARLSKGVKGRPVVTSASDPVIVALAARFAAGTGRPLLVSDSGSLSPEVKSSLRRAPRRITVVGPMAEPVLKAVSQGHTVQRIGAKNPEALSLVLAKADGTRSKRQFVAGATDPAAVVAAASAAGRVGGELLVVAKSPSEASVKYASGAGSTVVVAPKKTIPNSVAKTFPSPARVKTPEATLRSVRLGSLQAGKAGSVILVPASWLRSAATAGGSGAIVLLVPDGADKTVSGYLQRHPNISLLRSVGRPGAAVAAARQA